MTDTTHSLGTVVEKTTSENTVVEVREKGVVLSFPALLGSRDTWLSHEEFENLTAAIDGVNA
jgi:hypothetical protein